MLFYFKKAVDRYITIDSFKNLPSLSWHAHEHCVSLPLPVLAV
ncbi:MAG: hypothetical protein ACTSQS_06265 [Promethearchaeota archaeon]